MRELSLDGNVDVEAFGPTSLDLLELCMYSLRLLIVVYFLDFTTSLATRSTTQVIKD